MQRPFGFAIALVFGLVFAREARAAEREIAPASARVEQSPTPAGLLAAADAAVGAGDLPLARSLFEQLATQFPATPEASESRRALAIIAMRVAPTGHARAPASAPASATSPIR
jgi:outer membrane protein assembly factor BamD (BamD/ComL family)